MKFQHRFVDFIPDIIEEDVLYISLDFGTVIHKCACGCGNEVNTPLTPTGWKMIYNGGAVSLKPSIGNWSFDCKSHYWITNNSIEWSSKWSVDKINMARKNEYSERYQYYGNKDSQNTDDNYSELSDKAFFATRIKRWFRNLFFSH